MKRDLDLVRQLMLTIEGWPAGPPVQYRMGEVEDLVLLAHLEMLIDAGLVKGTISRSLGARGDVIAIAGLSWEGHEWIESVRSDAVWTETKRIIIEAGGALNHELTTAVASRILRTRLGLPPG